MSRLADWLAGQAPAWLRGEYGPLAPRQRRALLAIQRCRTPELGGRVYACDDCGKRHYAYHSCHHRACPRCGAADTAAWTRKQTERLLPVPYFFWTFTVPEQFRPFFRQHPEVLHPLLFQVAAQALQDVADRKHVLGGDLGLIAVLHTWGRQLQHHPHLHVIAPGGGLRSDGKRWQRCRTADWLLPIAAVKAAYRHEFAEALRARAPKLHAQIADSVWRKEWNVDVQPAGSGQAVLRYLARYVKRTAISDERILQANGREVTFAYTESGTGRRRELTLTGEQFMRRYLQHVPGKGEHRVRYFGWMHPSAKARRIKVETLLAVPIVVRAPAPQPPAWHLRCPHCQAFALVCVGKLPRGPPQVLRAA
jgi:hypothetical protein